MNVKLLKQLATMQDLALGTGTVNQRRNGENLTLDEIDFIRPSTLEGYTDPLFATIDDLISGTTLSGVVINMSEGAGATVLDTGAGTASMYTIVATGGTVTLDNGLEALARPMYSTGGGGGANIQLQNGSGFVDIDTTPGVTALFPTMMTSEATRDGATDTWKFAYGTNIPTSPPTQLVIASNDWTGIGANTILASNELSGWPLKRQDGTALQAGDLVNKQKYIVIVNYPAAASPYYGVQGLGNKVETVSLEPAGGKTITTNNGKDVLLYPEIQRYKAVQDGTTDVWDITIPTLSAYNSSTPFSMVIWSNNWADIGADTTVRISGQSGVGYPLKRWDGTDLQPGDLLSDQTPYLCLYKFPAAAAPYIALQGVGVASTLTASGIAQITGTDPSKPNVYVPAQTTAGILVNADMTADIINVNGTNYYSVSATTEGTIAEASQVKSSATGVKVYYDTQFLGSSATQAIVNPGGVYSGTLTVASSSAANTVQFGVDVWLADDLGVDISLVGSLDTVATTIQAGKQVVSIVGTVPNDIIRTVGQRFKLKPWCLKVGVGGAAYDLTLYSGTANQSYITIPVSSTIDNATTFTATLNNNSSAVTATTCYMYRNGSDETNSPTGASANAIGIANGVVIPLGALTGGTIKGINIKAAKMAVDGSPVGTAPAVDVVFYAMTGTGWTPFGGASVPVVSSDISLVLPFNNGSGTTMINAKINSLNVAIPDDTLWGAVLSMNNASTNNINLVGKVTMTILGVLS